MKHANRILELLYDRREHYTLPAELAQKAGVPVQRLPKALELLRHRGHVIESSPVDGLKLSQPIKLDAHLVERGLGTRRVGRNVICFDEVGSTNDVAFDAARVRKGGMASADGLVVLADSQRAGRGRRGRKWSSPPGSGILMSVLLIDHGNHLSHDALTIAAGLAVAEGIDDACGTSCRLKWPNDVMLDGHKLAGILVETRPVAGGACVVIGAGINVNAAPAASKLHQPATSLADHLGQGVERLPVVQAILRRLDARVAQAQRLWGRANLARAALEDIRTCWLARCDMINHRMTVADGPRHYEGRVLDVNPLQGLALQCDGGLVVHLPAANATVLK